VSEARADISPVRDDRTDVPPLARRMPPPFLADTSGDTMRNAAQSASSQTPVTQTGGGLGTPVSATAQPARYAGDIDPALYPVLDKVKGGESGGKYDALYGGGNFGFPSWPGRQGPAGMSHAAGGYGDQPGTWRQIATEVQQRFGRTLDFGSRKDQDFGNAYWMIKTYGRDANGHNLIEASKAGAVDYGRLAGQYASLGPVNSKGQPIPNAGEGQAQLRTINEQVGKLLDDVRSTGGRDKDTWRRLDEARTKMLDYERHALELSEKPPQADPRDAMQRLGGLATVVGILGGLLTKQPLMAALNAGGAAMEAYNKQDEATYQYQREQWKHHTDMLLKMAQFQHDQLRDVLDDEKLQAGERMQKVHVIASLLGHEQTGALAQISDEKSLRQWQASNQLAIDRLAETKRLDDARIASMGHGGRVGGVQNYVANAVESAREKAGGGLSLDEENKVARQAYDEWRSTGTMAGEKIHEVRQQQQELEEKLHRPLTGEEKTSITHFVEKGGITGNEQQRLQARDSLYADSLGFLDESIGMLDRHVGISGTAGRVTRLGERVGDLFGSDETDRVQFERNINYLKFAAPTLLLDRQGRPLSAEAGEINAIIGGLRMGDLAKNTIRSLERIQDIYKNHRQDLQLQLKGEWKPREQRGESPPAATSGALTTPMSGSAGPAPPTNWWESSPLAPPQ